MQCHSESDPKNISKNTYMKLQLASFELINIINHQCIRRISRIGANSSAYWIRFKLNAHLIDRYIKWTNKTVNNLIHTRTIDSYVESLVITSSNRWFCSWHAQHQIAFITCDAMQTIECCCMINLQLASSLASSSLLVYSIFCHKAIALQKPSL